MIDNRRGLIWADSAECAGTPMETFFPVETFKNAYDKARAICAVCPVSVECLAAAMAEELGVGPRSRSGMRGGLTPTQRDQAARR